MTLNACLFAFCATICLVASDQNAVHVNPADAVESDISLNGSTNLESVVADDTPNNIPAISEQQFFSSCREVPTNLSGFYNIRINNESEPFLGYCLHEKLGGGWLLVQFRFDGSVDFYRNWTEYRDGFGDNQKEFWIGLERLHQLTSATPHELLVQIRDFTELNAYAWYGEFEIGSESEQYQLKKLGRYSGSAGDSMSTQAGMKFSTMDRDNDEDSTTHCAQKHEGAWWYAHCGDANLNGRYMRGKNAKALYWYHFLENYEGLDHSKMMIRPAKKQLS
ncbi:ryncolin-4-like [Anopheles albimanus]|uniref:ryncolin-4-like n=1 Tax=Anopheles albimanus TaxID=7167 RepID=UPI00164157CC|nr:ryncolin-4-like [Anopheles albimanus]